MNRLALAQKLASESGTVHSGAGTLPSATTGQTNRLRKMVEWIDDAWQQIQIAHNSWLWMQGEFSGNLVSGTQRYASSAFNDFATSAAISRFTNWIYRRDPAYDSGISLYDSSVGVSDERALQWVSWDDFYTAFTRGMQTNRKPRCFTVTPDKKLAFGDTPDGNNYVVRGRYRKSAQVLADDDDEPEMPEDYHLLIVEVALMLVERYDENAFRIPLIQLRRSQLFRALEREQLPQIEFGSALA